VSGGAYKKWKEALANPRDVKELSFQARQLPRAKGGGDRKLPADIKKLENLRSLTIRGAGLGALCEELAELSSLESLSIDNTSSVLDLGPGLARLPSLRTLELYRVGLTTFVPLPSTLESLSLEANDRLDLESWFEGLAGHPSLRELNLSQAAPVTIPSSLGKLSQLRRIALAQNGYAYIPAPVFSLGSLESLRLPVNALTELPPQIGELKKLTELVVNANRIKSLPEELGRLESLERLWLGGNPLSALPDWIGDLKKLNTLNLAATALTDLPPALTTLPLKHLTVDVPARVLAELKARLPKCKIVNRTRADEEREVLGWLRFLGKA